jgi:hypothetical protein
MYSQENSFFRVRLLQKYSRITSTFPIADGEFYRRYISVLQSKFDHLAKPYCNPQMPLELVNPNNFNDLIEKVLPPDDSTIQFGPIQGGMANDLDAVFDDLYIRLVEAYLKSNEKPSKSEQEIWMQFSTPLRKNLAFSMLQSTAIQTSKDKIQLEHAWKNGKWKAIQPISFDLLHAGSIQNKSLQWFGTNILLNESPDIGNIFCLLAKPSREDKDLQKAYITAKDLLGSNQYCNKVEIIEEKDYESFGKQVISIIEKDNKHNS